MDISRTIYIGGLYAHNQIRHMHTTDKRVFADFLTLAPFRIVDEPIAADIFLALDYSPEEQEELKLRRSLGKQSILFRREPKCVWPRNFGSHIDELFNNILNFGRSSRDYPQVEHWPQFWPDRNIDFKIISSRKSKIAMINANKMSLHVSEQYSLRRKCMKEIADLETYGSYWEMSFKRRVRILFTAIRRAVSSGAMPKLSGLAYWFVNWPQIQAPLDKYVVLRDYQFSLVIENSVDYMTEKLFDVFFAGCIPIYAGPDVALFGIPENLVVQVKPTIDSIRAGIEVAKSIDYGDYLTNLGGWLNSKEAQEEHEGNHVLKRSVEFISKASIDFNGVR